MMVLFDLPTDTDRFRKMSSKFRSFLLDNGFKMIQYSVYMKFHSGAESYEKYLKKIQNNLPEYGNVIVVQFTDKQYENAKVFIGKSKPEFLPEQEQLTLF